ncbi:MAG: ABC transporter substrate-binding protein [Oscillospiraceae bacterium]|jgi:iron complex transport system substrate-binding protein|nr:ABC transporter substrate-binding protein [Oscillospiraceae bacterium]
MRKPIKPIVAALVCALVLTASASFTMAAAETSPESVTINTFNGGREVVELAVPYNPLRLAVMDLAALDMLDAFGLGDRVVGVSKGSSIDYLQSYVTNDDIINLGTIKEADLEAVMASEPDLIFIGGRLSSQYDTLSEIAPVVYLGVDAQAGLVESVRNNAQTLASIFGIADQVGEKLAGFDARIETLAGLAEGKTALVGLCTAGSFNVLGNDGRCSLIGVEVGFENLAAVDVTSTHGNETSFELIVSLAPDYIFVMDRDAAINAEGAKLAREIMENELVVQTDAYKNGNIVYLATPAVWYTAEGGITALDVMLSDLEGALVK